MSAKLVPDDPGCPPEEQFIELAEGQLSDATADRLRHHAAQCPSCYMRLVGLDDTAAGTSKASGGTEPSSEQAGHFVAEFRLIRRLGQGAMGEVFLARDTFLDRLVALKFLAAGETSTSARERFFVEARAVARLQHPNVVTLYRAGEEQGRRYLASEYVHGQSLERWPRPLPWTQALDIAIGLARGLATAHRRGVLHRDIKPANVIVTKGGEVKILDFGLAKILEPLPTNESNARDGDRRGLSLSASQSDVPEIANLALTKTGSLLGTPLYMAPEIWRGEPATSQTDVYSLGALLYELCTGKPPHHAETAMALGLRVSSSDATSVAIAAPAIDSRFAAVIDRCLQREPSKRFASGGDVQAVLERIAIKTSAISRRVAITGSSLVFCVFVIFIGLALSRDRQSKRQTELAQRLGQQIKDTEWLLRSARQLPAHDLEREKMIVRKRMNTIDAELLTYGELGRGLAYYALGSGHLALHEYSEALTQLQQAVASGNQRAEVHHALGLALGKHFEQVMREARMSGGGEWAKKQLRANEPRYLIPAIASLQRSRSMKLDAPEYLEGLIAFYKGDDDAALKYAGAARQEAPWLYEAWKLEGDIYLRKGQRALDFGKFADAEKYLRSAVTGYEAAAVIGQSDAEVHEGLAETWVNLTSLAQQNGKPTRTAYLETLRASDKINVVEPQNIVGPLKKAFAIWLTMEAIDPPQSLPEATTQCLANTEQVLRKQPSNPHATELQATCLLASAWDLYTQREDPEPRVRQAIGALESMLQQHPHFLSGIRTTGIKYLGLGKYLQRRGDSQAYWAYNKALEYFARARAIDSSDASSIGFSLDVRTKLILMTRSQQELRSILSHVDEEVHRCSDMLGEHVSCTGNQLVAYARAAARSFVAGDDPAPYLKRAMESTATLRKLQINLPETEEAIVLTHYVAAAAQVRRKQDPDGRLGELRESLRHCLYVAAKDLECLSRSAQLDWLESEWLADKAKPATVLLVQALRKAELATQSIGKPDDGSLLIEASAWQVLAESNLRLAQAGSHSTAEKDKYIAAGLAALRNAFSINPNYGLAWATQGRLQLLSASLQTEGPSRQESLQTALTAFAKAVHHDPLLNHDLMPLIKQAKGLIPSPTATGNQPGGKEPFVKSSF